MAIQGIFLADFSQYNAAVDGADAKLRKFTSATTTHDTAVQQFNRSTTGAYTGIGQLSQGLSAADKTLAAFGVHIGPEIHALDELSQASGKTASEIGAIGTASLVAAAALGGWEIGRTIAKFFDLDKAIANATSTLMGWGDLAAETAGAKQDSINLAISRGADATINYTQAIKFNKEWVEKAKDAQKEHTKELEAAKKASDDAAAATLRLQKAHEDAIHAGADKLFGNDAIKAAEDYIEEIGRLENVSVMTADAQRMVAAALGEAQEAMTRQGLLATDLFGQITQYRQALLDTIPAEQQHADAVVKMETDEERLARESAELAKAMKDNFVVIGHSAQETAQTIVTSFSDALDAVRRGQGTLTGTISGIAPGTPGSTIRYDDYGNPYGYIPGVNQPGRLSPTGGNSNIFVDARESFFDSPAGAQRLADKVVQALGTRLASQGGR